MTSPAQLYVDERGQAVTDWLASFIEQQFGRVVEGLPMARSQFGVMYEEFVIFFDVRDGHEQVMNTLRTYVDQWLPIFDSRKGMTLVWRTRPMIYASPNSSFDDPDGSSEPDENRVRIRFRHHTMPGTDVEANPSPTSSAGHAN